MTMFRFLMAKQNSSAGYIIFAGGYLSSGAATNISDKYIIPTDAVSVGPSLSSARESHAAGGDRSISILACGKTGSTIITSSEKLNFQSESFSSASSLSTARYILACSSGQGFALFAGGTTSITPNVVTNSTEKYNLSTEARSSGGNLTAQISNMSGSGNAQIGIFAGQQASGGSALSSVDKYTYSSDTSSAGTALSVAKFGCGAHSNKSISIIAGGWLPNATDVVEKYNLQTDSRTLGTSLGTKRSSPGSGGNEIACIFACGYTNVTFVNTSEKYVFSSDSRTNATTLTGSGRNSLTGSSSQPGHL